MYVINKIDFFIIKIRKYNAQKKNLLYKILLLLVEKTGFEPATSWSRTKCTTKLCYFSNIYNKKS